MSTLNSIVPKQSTDDRKDNHDANHIVSNKLNGSQRSECPKGDPIVTRFRYHALEALLAKVERCSSDGKLLSLIDLQADSGKIEAALEDLPLRWRTIITRCDLGGELHVNVAHDLGITKRHFYRERRKALVLLAKVIRNSTRAAAQPRLADPNAETAVIGVVNLLSHTGRVAQAIPALEGALQDASCPESRIRLLLKLSGVHCQLHALDKASATIGLANKAFREATVDVEKTHTLQLEIAMEESNLLRYRSNFQLAKKRLLDAIAYYISNEIDGFAVRRAFADTQLALANLLGLQDQFAAAVGYASEAERILRQYESDVALLSRAKTQLATIRFCGGMVPSRDLVEDLKAAYALAQSNGFASDLHQSAISLSTLYSLAKRHREALAYARSALYLVQAAGLQGQFVTGAYYCLASAQIAAGDVTSAKSTLRSVYTSVHKHPWMEFPLTELLEARILFAARRSREALRSASNAVTRLGKAEQPRIQGTALQLRAAIEASIGNRRCARECVHQAIALLERGAPVGMLGDAYALSATITGSVKHSRRATEFDNLAMLPEVTGGYNGSPCGQITITS